MISLCICPDLKKKKKTEKWTQNQLWDNFKQAKINGIGIPEGDLTLNVNKHQESSDISG